MRLASARRSEDAESMAVDCRTRAWREGISPERAACPEHAQA